MGLDTRTHSSLWKDRAVIEINAAVLYSYQVRGVVSSRAMSKYENGWEVFFLLFNSHFDFPPVENERDYRRSSHSIRIFYEVS